MYNNRRVAVIGAGISGLAAAHRLLELDPSLDLALFESSDRVGGVIRTQEMHAFRIEHGPDGMLTQTPWATDLCRRLGLQSQLVQTNPNHHGVYVVCRRRLRRLPDGLALMAPQRLWPVIASPILSLRGKLRLACERFVPPRQTPTDESLAQFVTRRLGREAFDRLVQPLVSGIYMGSADSLSVRATFPRFVEMEERHGSLLRAVSIQKQEQKAKSPQPSMFVSLQRGMEQLPKAIAERLPTGCIRLCCRVQELTRLSDGRWRVMTLEHPGQPCVETFDAVIVATNVPAAARLLHDSASSLSAELSAIDHSSCVVVNLAFRRPQIRHPLDAFGFVSPVIEERQVTACTFSSVKYPGRAPEDNCLVRAYLGGTAHPEALSWSDAEVKHVVHDELAELLGIHGNPLLVTVQRWRRMMPQYEVGHLDRVDRIERLISKLPGLALAGNAFRGAGVSQCVRSGELAAQAAIDHLCELSAATTHRS